MSQKTRKRVVLAAIESVYGTDAMPTGSANAITAKNLNITPLQASKQSRAIERPYFGNSEELLSEIYSQISFEVEAVGLGVVGGIPGMDPLIRSCAFSKQQVFSALTSLVSASGVATATRNAHGKKVGDKVIIGGANETAYNGVQTITAVTTNTFSYAVSGSPASPATGAPTVVESVDYNPISENIESATMYFYVDRILHIATGCRGTFEIDFTVKNIPVFKFTFTGICNPAADVASPVVDFSKWQVPQIVNTQNTPGFSLFGYSGIMESMSLNIANDVQYITLVGEESVQILNRQPSGSLLFQAPTIAEIDFFELAKQTASGVMSLNHGSKNGFKVAISGPRVQIGNPNYKDSNGVQMLEAPFTVNPISGNDELKISFS